MAWQSSTASPSNEFIQIECLHITSTESHKRTKNQRIANDYFNNLKQLLSLPKEHTKMEYSIPPNLINIPIIWSYYLFTIIFQICMGRINLEKKNMESPHS